MPRRRACVEPSEAPPAPRAVSRYRLHLALAAAVLALAAASLSLGAEPLDVGAAFGRWFAEPDAIDVVILREIRLPRTLLALIAGASLGLAGAAMQGLLRNPLASPGLVGSSAGAALGAVSVLYFGGAAGIAAGGGWFAAQAVPLAGMAGALLATGLVYALAGRDASITTLILAGVAINAFATAGMSLLLNLAPSPFAVRELVLWTLGDLADRGLPDVYTLLPCTLAGWAMLAGTGRSLDALTLGERGAASLGVSAAALRLRVLVATSLAVGATVATTGMIGFVGLVVPHLLRPLVGHEPGRLLGVSALGGAVLLLAADLGVRLVPTDNALKVGVLTSLVGAPFFLWLILASRRVQPLGDAR